MYRIVEALPQHIGPVATVLPWSTRNVLEASGLAPRKAIRALFQLSAYRRTVLLDDRPVGMWGLTGTMMADEGEVWLALGDAARAFPRAIVREAVREIGGLMMIKREIRSSVLCQDARALRFAQFLGFRVSERAVSPTQHFMMVLAQ